MAVETIVAVAIITVAIIIAMEVAQKSVSLSRRAFHVGQATFLLEEGGEAVRIVRDNAWASIGALSTATAYYPTFSGGTWTLSTTPNTVGIFTRTVTIQNVNRDGVSGDINQSGTNDEDTKLVTVTISWNEAGVVVTKTVQFYIMNIFS